MDLDGPGWTWMDLDGPGWTWMDLDGPGWTWMTWMDLHDSDSGVLGWTQTPPNKKPLTVNIGDFGYDDKKL